MILGTGVDIIEVARVRNAVNKWGDRFIKKIFTDKEIEYSKKKRFMFQHLAARFATKEAVVKALGDGWQGQVTWKDLEILNEENGKPRVNLLGRAEQVKQEKGISDIIVSMSHTENYAVASAILVKNDRATSHAKV